MKRANENADNALRIAIEKNYVEIAKILISHGADFKTVGLGYAPLHYAILYDRPEITIYLLIHGADIYAKDGIGRTVFQVAKHEKWNLSALIVNLYHIKVLNHKLLPFTLISYFICFFFIK
ncbi:hypothetical protein TVAG_071870 [Trichomonas vaginalis G3]|uniref:Uncharacterized protein n=1 Tax=Trichomonas vaginalis (strain ATCC PRA-98 / G3) TaxID=412133 RepID=A2D890_TRIV3|nr:spectrin binding [Trichomonas vaginalis G3]EAY23523.1 hypothetical protein TVAG_071870 [Trichomonas vaginalis G3]KAI5493945.1 spectrin binding [Trichomonas vaginalis G3]|eukprot:XP_001584509.1 hypothetical protein [Trichomonas vaginalis G3]